MSNTQSSGGIGILEVLFVVFLTLKLTGNITWSWFWVLSPLLIPWRVIGVILVFAGVIWAVAGILDAIGNRRKFNNHYKDYLDKRK